MFIVSYKLKNIAQVELNEVMKLMYDLHVMYIFMFVVCLLFYSEKNNELH